MMIRMFVMCAILLGSHNQSMQAYEPIMPDPLPSFQVLIDVGHGGIDGGAVHGKTIEKEINLAVANELYKLLNDQGISAIINRDRDYALSEDNRWLRGPSRHQRDLAQRSQLTEELPIDMVISLHVNATKNKSRRGPLVLHQRNEQSVLLAQSIQTELNRQQSSSRLPRLGKTYYLLNRIKQPAVIVEMGFLTNAEDRSMLTNSTEQAAIAEAITEGIKHYLLIRYSASSEEIETTP